MTAVGALVFARRSLASLPGEATLGGASDADRGAATGHRGGAVITDAS